MRLKKKLSKISIAVNVSILGSDFIEENILYSYMSHLLVYY